MPKRPKLLTAIPEDGIYFPSDRPAFLPSGCTLLDAALNGGWALGRVVNLVGDKSTGKTLLAIEAAANFARKFPDGDIYYLEAEAAFDLTYAAALGLPVDRVSFVETRGTVEDLFEHLDLLVKATKKSKKEVLYIVDSLDALSDRKEQERGIDEGTMGMGKSKKMSELFRRLNQRLNTTQILLFIISQVRENLNAGFGDKYTRAGGRALDFYASQIVWLAHLGLLHKTRKGVKRVVGVNVKAKVKKSKVGPPWREAEFPIIFGYGVEDVSASLTYLVSAKRTREAGLPEQKARYYLARLDALPEAKYHILQKRTSKAIRKVWADLEREFAPRRGKY